jgi:hypothetical protein
MKHYNKNFLRKYIKQLEKDGFTCINNGKHITVRGGEGCPQYILHTSPKSYHPLRRFLKSNYDYAL